MKIPFGKLCLAGALALASVTPAAASSGSAGPGGHGQAGQHGKAGQQESPAREHGPSQQGQSHGKAKGKAKVHKVTYVFRGVWNAAMGTVTVRSGNHHVRKAGFVSEDVEFDLSGAKVVVADTDGDGARSAADLKDGDRVVVKARLPRKDPGEQPFTAKMVVDQTNPPVSGDGDTAD